MISKQMIFNKTQYDKILQSVKNFVKSKGYFLYEEPTDSANIFTIFNRKPESGSLSGIIDFFVGRKIIGERIRLIVRIIPNSENVIVDIRGDVMMGEGDYVYVNPGRRDYVKCIMELKELEMQLSELNSDEKY